MIDLAHTQNTYQIILGLEANKSIYLVCKDISDLRAPCKNQCATCNYVKKYELLIIEHFALKILHPYFINFEIEIKYLISEGAESIIDYYLITIKSSAYNLKHELK